MATTLNFSHVSFLMAWTNLFLMSWPLQEASREIVTVALHLQLLHYLANMAGLMFLLVLLPASYPLVLGLMALVSSALGPSSGCGMKLGRIPEVTFELRCGSSNYDLNLAYLPPLIDNLPHK